MRTGLPDPLKNEQTRLRTETKMAIKAQNTPRTVLFVLFNAMVLLVYYYQLSDLIRLNELYSHIALVPFVSGYFIFQDRSKIFHDTGLSIVPGLLTIAAGGVLYLLGTTQGALLNQNDYFSVLSLAVLMIWTGGFILFFGVRAFRNAAFPIKFLIFIIPFPTFAVDLIILLLQSASTEVSHVLFQLSGVPVYRDGFVFHLPGVSVEVAKECSGIRSSIALFITSIIAGHMFLKTGWKKAVLALMIFPLTVFKNGIRILTLSLLGAYVDTAYLTDSLLHKKGGVLFFLLALIFFLPVFWLIVRSEKSHPKGRAGESGKA